MSDKLTNGSVENVDQTVPKLGSRFCSKISAEETCLLPAWHPAYSWHELDPGSRVERGNLLPRCQGRNPSGGPTRMRVPRRSGGTEQPVLAMKSATNGWSEGVASSSLGHRSTV